MAHMLQVRSCPYSDCWCGGQHACFVTSNSHPEWHRLGLNRGRRFSVREAVRDCCLYLVRERKAGYLDQNGKWIEDPTRKVLVRDDMGDRDVYLGSVGAGYTAVQFQDLLGLLELALTDKGGGEFLDTCGLLGDRGERLFACVDLGEIVAQKGDTLKRYLLLYSGNDGSNSVTFRRCATRVVCQNTANVALNESTPWEVKIRHTRGANTALKDLAKALAGDRKFEHLFQEGCQYLADREISGSAELDALVEAILPLPKKQEEPSTILKTKRNRIKALADGEGIGTRLNGKLTRWDVWNGTTQWIDRDRSVSGGVRALDNVLNKNAQDIRNRAWGVLTTLEPEVDRVLVGVGS